MPNYLGGGQSFVQAGNNNGGGFNRLAFFGVGAMQMKMGHMMRSDLISRQGEEQRKTISHKTDEGIRADIAKGFVSRQHLVGDYDTIFAKDENGNPLRPEMAEHFRKGGLVRNAHGIQPGPIAGIDIATINAGNADVKAKDRQARAKEKEEAAANKPKPRAKFDPENLNNGFEGYTPRKTGTGGYDEALKEGKIDKETYDSYVEDAASSRKHYMPTQASTAINTLVKERQDAENNDGGTPPPPNGNDSNNTSRKDNLDTGTGEGK